MYECTAKVFDIYLEIALSYAYNDEVCVCINKSFMHNRQTNPGGIKKQFGILN